MNREEAQELLIHILMTYEPKDQYGDYDDPEPYEQAITMAIEALSEPRGDIISREAETVDCTELIRWLTETVMDDSMWELNAVAYGEVIARKLTKLGVLEVKDDVYVYEPSADPKTDEENELKFYYVESIDDYWVGRRLDNFYYANWHKGLGFVWSHSRYLPWGEHIVDENTLWKEHTYPSEPIEIPFTEWVVGFVKKYFTEPKTGEWIFEETDEYKRTYCSVCGVSAPFVCVSDDHYGRRCHGETKKTKFCPNCGARMKSDTE